MAMIEVENLCRTYRMGRAEVPVLRGVSLRVEKGECVAVLEIGRASCRERV